MIIFYPDSSQISKSPGDTLAQARPGFAAYLVTRCYPHRWGSRWFQYVLVLWAFRPLLATYSYLTHDDKWCSSCSSCSLQFVYCNNAMLLGCGSLHNAHQKHSMYPNPTPSTECNHIPCVSLKASAMWETIIQCGDPRYHFIKNPLNIYI